VGISLLGIQEYLNRFPGDRSGANTQDRIGTPAPATLWFQPVTEWNWFEDVLAYSNARLAQSG
jgi:hypothetical protein